MDSTPPHPHVVTDCLTVREAFSRWDSGMRTVLLTPLRAYCAFAAVPWARGRCGTKLAGADRQIRSSWSPDATGAPGLGGLIPPPCRIDGVTPQRRAVGVDASADDHGAAITGQSTCRRPYGINGGAR